MEHGAFFVFNFTLLNMRARIGNPLNNVIGRAVELSRQPGAQPRTSGAGRAMNTNEDNSTTAHADGYTIHDFFVDFDSIDDPYSSIT